MTDGITKEQHHWPKCPGETPDHEDHRNAAKLESASNLTNPGLGENCVKQNKTACKRKEATSESTQMFFSRM